jgi:addiction module HigA family antidote
MGLTQKTLAAHLGISVQRVNEIIRGKRGISPHTAWLLSEAFSTTPEFWSNLQTMHDLSATRPSTHVAPIVEASA